MRGGRAGVLAALVVALALGAAGFYSYRYGPCGTAPVTAGQRSLTTYHAHWLVQFELAQGTATSALAGPLAALQADRAAVAALAVPHCLRPTQAALLAFMDAGIAGHAARANQAGDAAVRAHFAEMNAASETYHQAMFGITACAPFCEP